jgi:hypothetical protein
MCHSGIQARSTSRSRDFATELGRLVGWPASWIALGSIAGTIGFTYILIGAAFQHLPDDERQSIAPLLQFPDAQMALPSVIVTLGGMIVAAYAGGVSRTRSNGGLDASGPGNRDQPVLMPVWRILALSTVLLVGSVLVYGWAMLMAVTAASVAGLSAGGEGDELGMRQVPVLIVRTWWALMTLAAIAYGASTASGRRFTGLAVVIGLLLAEQLAQVLFSAGWLRLAPHATAATIAGGASEAELPSAVLMAVIYVVGALTLPMSRLGRPNHPTG